jgi:hypothetical protein
MLDFTANAPMPTPMPGTNLSLEDVNPAIVVHSPSVTSTTKKTSQEPSSYFDIPRNDHAMVQHAGDPAATAGVTAAPGKSYQVGTLDIHDNKNTPGSERSVVPVIPAQPSDVSAAGCSGDIVPQSHSRVHKNRSSETPNENGSCEYRTLRYRRANGTIAERRIVLRSDGEPHQDIRSESDADDYDYTAWDAMSSTTGTSGSNGLQRRRSTWSRHTGLYDGTGYGDDSPLTSGQVMYTDSMKPIYLGSSLSPSRTMTRVAHSQWIRQTAMRMQAPGQRLSRKPRRRQWRTTSIRCITSTTHMHAGQWEEVMAARGRRTWAPT